MKLPGEIDVTTPNGKFRICTIPDEFKMSHWVYQPQVWELSENILLLDAVCWDLRALKFDDQTIEMEIYRYPNGLVKHRVEIDLNAKTGSFDDGKIVNLPNLQRLISDYKVRI